MFPRALLRWRRRVGGVRTAAGDGGRGQVQITENLEEKIADSLRVALSPSDLELVDRSGGCGTFFHIRIVSDKFAGLSALQRNRLVNNQVKPWMEEMHGITVEALTPGERP